MNEINRKLQEANWFFQGMQHFAKEHAQHCKAGHAAFTQITYPIVRHFQYNLSAMLSAAYCVLNYMQNNCDSPERQRWFKSVEADRRIKPIAAMRHADIHDETAQVIQRVVIPVAGPEQADLVLSIENLSKVKTLKRRPSVIKYLCARPILELAGEGLNGLEEAVKEFQKRAYFRKSNPD